MSRWLQDSRFTKVKKTTKAHANPTNPGKPDKTDMKAAEKKYPRKTDKPEVGRPAEVLGVREQTSTATDVAKCGGGGGRWWKVAEGGGGNI